MKAQNIISAILLLTYSIMLTHSLVPHCHHLFYGSQTETHHHHEHHIHSDHVAAPDHDHFEHEDHFDEDLVDLVVCT